MTCHGYGDTTQTVKKAWDMAPRTAAKAVPTNLLDVTSYAGSVEACIDCLQAQEENGVDIHSVYVDTPDSHEYEQVLKKLVE